MNTIDSDVFIIRQLEDLNQTQTYYQKHLKFSLKSKFYLGLPIGSDDNIIEEFNDLFQESSVNGTIFYYFNFLPHQKIQSIIDEFQENIKWNNNQIHLLPHKDLLYGSYKEELWDLHIQKYSVYFHEINEVKEFAKNIDLISKLNARGGIIGIGSNGLTSKKVVQLAEMNAVNFWNTQQVNIHSPEYAEALKMRREFEDLILNSGGLDQSGEVLN